jgi:hypothetical protein
LVTAGHAARRAGVIAALLLALCPSPSHAASPERYWEFTDRRASDIDADWDQQTGYYRMVSGFTTRLNADMLEVFALAARAGHAGPARNDARARLLVDRLLQPPAWTDTGTAGQSHGPGWTAGLDAPGPQHVSIDARVASALAAAWRARAELGLGQDRAELIAARIHAVAASAFFAWPAIRLDQFNWQADLYAADWAVTGDPLRVRADYREQLRRFVASSRRPSPRSPWLNAGLGLNYMPRHSSWWSGNRVSTSEYGGVVLSGLRYYSSAVAAAGMRRLDAGEERLLAGFARRQLFGEWTHAGYLNWDTALGFRRWHLQRYWPLAATGLVAVAEDRRLFAASDRRTAVYLIDAALATYERWQRSHTAGATAFGIASPAAAPRDERIITSRWAVIGARAATSQLPGGDAPRAWFASDPDIGRIAVSTARYWTAITPITPAGYGGVELARLHGASSGRPASGTGGRAEAAFGLQLRRRHRTLLDTQATSRRSPPSHWRLDAPGMRGSFEHLNARTVVRRPGTRVTVEHEFRLGSIRTVHTIRASRGATARLRFPIWGDHPVRLPAAGVHAGQRLELGGYRVRMDAVPSGATLKLSTIAAQPSSPGTTRVVSIGFRVHARRPARIADSVIVAR